MISETRHYAAVKVAIELEEIGLSLESEVDPSGFCCEDLYACAAREACECGYFADELFSVHGSLIDYDGSLETPNSVYTDTRVHITDGIDDAVNTVLSV